MNNNNSFLNAGALLSLAVFASFGSVLADDQQNSESTTQKTQAIDAKPLTGEDIDNLQKQGDELESEANKLIECVNQDRQDKAEQLQQEQNQLVPGEVRVNHVPEFIKDEIKQQLRSELRQKVLSDVLETAKIQRWGIANAQPEWFSRIKLKGDIRLRGESFLFADDNSKPPLEAGYVNFNKINQKGGIAKTDPDDLYYNTWQDRHRMRVRARVGIDAKISASLKAVVRFSTGNINNPVSTNQTLGQYGSRYQLNWDHIYLQYKGPLTAVRPWVQLTGGRMPNPFFSTDLIWDNDLAFEGLAASFNVQLGSREDLFDITENDASLFFTLGIFPLEELALSAEDKWLGGTQLGALFEFDNQSTFKIGIAYYRFINTTGKKNTLDNRDLDYTAPGFVQKGNLMFDIRNSSTSTDENLFALAADYQELALTLKYDISSLAPIHIILSTEVVKNIGFNADEIRKRTTGSSGVTRSGGILAGKEYDENTMGYDARVTIGWPSVTYQGNWRVTLAYRRLEADAVMDAFTDSNFRQGGTDAQGWIAQYEHGLTGNAWLSMKYLSASEIESAPYSVETIQLDINAKF